MRVHVQGSSSGVINPLKRRFNLQIDGHVILISSNQTVLTPSLEQKYVKSNTSSFNVSFLCLVWLNDRLLSITRNKLPKGWMDGGMEG